MKAPIITNENGDICFFESVQDANRYLELIDIRNEEYEIYDSEGAILKGISAKPTIEIVESGENPNKAKPTSILREFYTNVGLKSSWIEKATLEELVERGMEDYAHNVSTKVVLNHLIYRD